MEKTRAPPNFLLPNRIIMLTSSIKPRTITRLNTSLALPSYLQNLTETTFPDTIY